MSTISPSRRSLPVSAAPTFGQSDESYASSADVQVVTGLERRRRWTEEQKAVIVSESMAPGASVLAVARKYDVHPRVIFRWKAKLIEECSAEAPLSLPAPGLKKRGRKPKNKAVDVVPAPKVFTVESAPPPMTAPSEGVRLVVGDLVITISTGSSR